MRRPRAVFTLGLVGFAVISTAAHCYASITTVPAGLAPGSEYRLVFVTEDSYAADSTSISTYNTEVNTEADSVAALDALATTWLAIGSTATTDAITNIGQDPSVPIYNLDGQLVAGDATTNSGGLFSGSLMNAILYDELGQQDDAPVYTGTRADGTGAAGGLMGTSNVEVGLSKYESSEWVDSGTTFSAENGLPLYAISAVLTVPTPEPTTSVPTLLSGAVLIIVLRRRHRTHPALPIETLTSGTTPSTHRFQR